MVFRNNFNLMNMAGIIVFVVLAFLLNFIEAEHKVQIDLCRTSNANSIDVLVRSEIEGHFLLHLQRKNESIDIQTEADSDSNWTEIAVLKGTVIQASSNLTCEDVSARQRTKSDYLSVILIYNAGTESI